MSRNISCKRVETGIGRFSSEISPVFCMLTLQRAHLLRAMRHQRTGEVTAALFYCLPLITAMRREGGREGRGAPVSIRRTTSLCYNRLFECRARPSVADVNRLKLRSLFVRAPDTLMRCTARYAWTVCRGSNSRVLCTSPVPPNFRAGGLFYRRRVALCVL